MAAEVVINVRGTADSKQIEAAQKHLDALGPSIEKALKSAGPAAESSSKALKQLGDDAEAAGKKAEGAGGLFGKLTGALGSPAMIAATGGLAAVGAGVVAVGAAIPDLIGKAEALGDAQARVAAVWGEATAGYIEDNAEVANSLGLTKTAYLDQVGAIGQLATSLGVNGDAARDMAQDFTELAPQLAAYAGVEGEVASGALEAALSGKTKGLQALGIAITDADKAGAALALGITAEPAKWTEAQVAQVNYQAVMEKTKAAQDAWAGNSGDVDTSMKRISAAVDDAKTSIGEKLLPVLAPLIEKIAAALPGAIQKAMGFLTTLGAWFEKGRAIVQPVIDIVMNFASTILGLGDKLKGGDLSKVGGDLMSSLADGLRGAGRFVSEGFSKVVAWATDALSKVDWGKVGGDLITMLSDGVVRGVSLISSVFVTIAGAAMDVMKNTDWAKLAKDVVVLLSRGLEAAVHLIAGAIVTLVKKIGQVLRETDWVKIAKDTITALAKAYLGLVHMFLDIGKSIVDGIVKGITGNQGAVDKAAAGSITSAAGAARRSGKVFSPSRVFAEIGTALMLGLALGITTGGKSADAAMESAITSATEHGVAAIEAAQAKMAASWADFLTPPDFSKLDKEMAGRIGHLEFLARKGAGTHDDMKRGLIYTGEREGRKAYGSFEETAVGAKAVADIAAMRAALAHEADPAKIAKGWEELKVTIAAAEEKRHEWYIAAFDEAGQRADGFSVRAEAMKANEDARHEEFMAALSDEDRALAKSQQAIADAEAARQAAFERARQAIQTAQSAAEQRETLIGAAVMEQIEQQAQAWEKAHLDKLAGLDAEKTVEDTRHTAAMAALAAEKDKWSAYLAEQEAGVKKITDAGAALDLRLQHLKMDLGMDAEAKKLSALKDQAADFASVLGKLEVFDPKKAHEAAKKAASEKIMLTSQEQKDALRARLGGIGGDDLRTATLLLQGHAMNAEKVRALMSRIQATLTGQVDAEQKVLDAKQAQIDALQHEIDLNKLLGADAAAALAAEKDRVGVILAGIDKREEAENTRNANELGRIAGLVAAENAAYDKLKQRIEDMKLAEADRHTDRMRQIGEEYAMKLLLLDHTPDEVAAIIAAAAAEAKGIADEAAKLFAAVGTAGEAAFDKTAAAADRTWKVIIQIRAEVAGANDATVLLASNLGLVAKRLSDVAVSIKKVGDALVEVDKPAGQSHRQRMNQTTRQGRGGFRALDDWEKYHYGPKSPMGDPNHGGVFGRSDAGGAAQPPKLTINVAPMPVTIEQSTTTNLNLNDDTIQRVLERGKQLQAKHLILKGTP